MLVTNVSNVFLLIGSGLVGGGVFAVLLKSNQFTELFKKHITEVIYCPSEYQSNADLNANWDRVTEALLKIVLPAHHELAINHLKEVYFDSALNYHFEDYSIHYSIEWIDPKKHLVEITNKTTSKVIPSPQINNPVFEWDFSVNKKDHNNIEVVDFTLNNIDLTKKATLDSNDKFIRKTLSVPIPCEGPCELDRTIKSIQCLDDESYMEASLIRYVKNLTIKFTYNNNHKFPDAPKLEVSFKALGMKDSFSKQFVESKRGGSNSWKHNGLLLPNQGYILIINKVIT